MRHGETLLVAPDGGSVGSESCLVSVLDFECVEVFDLRIANVLCIGGPAPREAFFIHWDGSGTCRSPARRRIANAS